MFVFNNTEEEWFCSWVVMRRKFLKSQENVRGLINDLKESTSKTNDLRIEITSLKEDKSELLKSNNFLKQRVKELQNIKSESEERMEMIKKFNDKNNLNRKRKKKKPVYRKK